MRAAVLNQVGDTKLELRDDVRTVEVGLQEVRIRVRAPGVCHSDLSAMDGTLPALAPGIVGHEGAGEILEVGAGVDHLAVGAGRADSMVWRAGRLDLDGMISKRITLEEIDDGLREPLTGGTLIRQIVTFG